MTRAEVIALVVDVQQALIEETRRTAPVIPTGITACEMILERLGAPRLHAELEPFLWDEIP
jgi:hypothetical protein